MKKLLVGLLLIAGTAYAETTPNLINNNNWSGVGAYAPAPNDCCSNPAGSQPLYDTNTNTIKFSYGQATVQQGWAINQALQGTGIQVGGYNYSYDLRNMNGKGGGQSGADSLTVNTWLKNSAGQIILSTNNIYNTQFDWTSHSGTMSLTSPMATTDLGSGGVSFSGKDGGYWGGLYGPEVRNVNYSLNYTVDQCTVNPQSSPTCPGFKTYYQMSDDGYAQVNLPFPFPFYGQLFTTSYMYTNGVVGFLNNNWGFCCDGTDLNNQVTQPNSPWNYSIYALNTDLIPGPNSEFYTQQTDNGTGLRYSWVNVPEIGTSLNNTFHVEIKNSGYIGITYDEVNLNPNRNPLIGIAGDISQGQYSMSYYGQASGLPALAGTTNVYTGTETTDYCSVNPLLSTSCPGYAAAYLDQQCTINTLYDPSCPGYALAYYNYQCSLDALYHTGCPGYEQAYYNQQCTLDALYDAGCPGYKEAYATKLLLEKQNNQTTAEVTTTAPAEVSATGDATVDKVIKTETASATSATAVVQLAPSPTQQSVTQTAQTEETTQDDMVSEKPQQENSTSDTQTASNESNGSSGTGSEKTKRKELAAKRAEARKKAALKAGKAATENMDSAKSMEAQVALQNVVIGAMAFVPGFNAYDFIMPDGLGYKPFQIYKKQANVDNARLVRGLSGASEKLHTDLVNLQYVRN